MGEPVRERAVVRQEQHAGRVAIEPPDGNDAHVAADEVDDGRPPLRVARGRDRPARLVEQHVPERLLPDLAAVDAHDVRGLDERVELARSAVHSHAPGLDQLVRAAARGDTGSSEVGVEAHGCILAAVTLPACSTTPT